MIAELRAKSQITIPKEIIADFSLNTGDKLDIVVKDGMICLIPVEVYPKAFEAWGTDERNLTYMIGGKIKSLEDQFMKFDNAAPNSKIQHIENNGKDGEFTILLMFGTEIASRY